MSRTEVALRAIRTQIQFDMVQAAADVAQAAAELSGAQGRVAELTRRCESFGRELTGIIARPAVNPALLNAVWRCLRVQRTDLGEWRRRRAEALRREQDLRSTLADLRNRERSLERALKEERRERQASRQALETIRADEIWLQHSLREDS